MRLLNLLMMAILACTVMGIPQPQRESQRGRTSRRRPQRKGPADHLFDAWSTQQLVKNMMGCTMNCFRASMGAQNINLFTLGPKGIKDLWNQCKNSPLCKGGPDAGAPQLVHLPEQVRQNVIRVVDGAGHIAAQWYEQNQGWLEPLGNTAMVLGFLFAAVIGAVAQGALEVIQKGFFGGNSFV